MYSREFLAKTLATGSFSVTFTKVDGTERVMQCTIAPHLIPEEKMPNPENSREVSLKKNLDILRVYDLEKEDWRSFRVESVTDVSLNN